MLLRRGAYFSTLNALQHPLYLIFLRFLSEKDAVMYEYTVPLRNFCHEANHVFHTSFCLCCGSLSFEIIFSAALELVVIHHATDSNNRFNENKA